MVAVTIPVKTPAGQAEMTSRERRVSQRHRTVLFLVDGKRPVSEVRSMASAAGVPETCFDELLRLGLIALPQPAAAPRIDLPAAPRAERFAPPLRATEDVPTPAVADSVLPASRTLYPSVSTDSTLRDAPVTDSWLGSEVGSLPAVEPAVAEARLILLRAVRAEAPLAGSLTALRLRRARTRADLMGLLQEVEARITRPHRLLVAAQTMRRVRLLLDGRVDSSLEPA